MHTISNKDTSLNKRINHQELLNSYESICNFICLASAHVNRCLAAWHG